MNRPKTVAVIPSIESRIHNIRGQNVMLDNDLATLYGVETKMLVRATKRNIDRFPGDFMFRLSSKEFENLRCQIGTSKKGRGGRRYLPYVFTEHGAVMLASVLNSSRAIETSIFVVRAFVKMREILSVHKEFARKLLELERQVAGHGEDIGALIEAIKELIEPPPKSKKQIGFKR